MRQNVLIVANRTAASPELLAFMSERPDASYELVVPPGAPGPDGRAAARRNLDAALQRCADAGLQASGVVGSVPDPVVAAIEAYDPAHHDEIVVSTLPASTSHWLHVDGPARIAKATDAIVRHVVSAEPRPEPRVVHRERAPGPGVLAPFNALGYGGRRQRA